MREINRLIAMGSLLTALTALAPLAVAQTGGEPEQNQPPSSQNVPDSQPPQFAPPLNDSGGWQGQRRGRRGGFGGQGQGGPGPGGFSANGRGGGGFGGSDADREARMAKFMQRFDANGDGTLDASEKAKAQELRERFAKGRGGRPGGPGFGGPGEFSPPGEGNQSGNPMENFGGFRGKNRSNVGGDWSSKKQERQQKLMQRFDANGDGSLDADEKAQRDQFVSEMKQRHQQRRHQQQSADTTQ